jgi:hypothetical protein
MSFYVTVFDKATNTGVGRIGLLAGPFDAHGDAIELVTRARDIVERLFPYRAHFWAFGTCRCEPCGVGRINHLLNSPDPRRL